MQSRLAFFAEYWQRCYCYSENAGVSLTIPELRMLMPCCYCYCYWPCPFPFPFRQYYSQYQIGFVEVVENNGYPILSLLLSFVGLVIEYHPDNIEKREGQLQYLINDEPIIDIYIFIHYLIHSLAEVGIVQTHHLQERKKSPATLLLSCSYSCRSSSNSRENYCCCC